MIKSFSKIFAIGTEYIKDIFKEDVEITEKIDGSQFCFGKIDNELFLRSKGRQIFPESPDKMFEIAVDYVLSVQDRIPDNTVYYCEYLAKPKHNVLVYGRVPKNNLILFGVSDGREKFVNSHEELKEKADEIEIEAIPLVYKGKIKKAEEIFDLIKKESILGGVDMEGIVVKNYSRQFLLGERPIALMAGKYVSEKFKEVHQSTWGKEKTHKGKFEVFKDSFRTEARWDKAIQHLRDDGKLENSPKDIGNLIVEVQKDIGQEEKENIKNFLWKEFGKEVTRHAIKGLPEYYKKEILKGAFDPLKEE